jgi:hypothetical protein
MGNMDDVVIDVTKNETQVSFAMQLKHKENKKKRSRLRERRFQFEEIL